MRAPTLKAYWFIGMFAGLGGVYGAACIADNPNLNLEDVQAPSGSTASTGGGNTGGGTPASGSGGGGMSVSSSGGGGVIVSVSSSGGPMEPCPGTQGCKAPDAICGAGTCTDGKCVFTQKTLASDRYGDCHKTVCDAQGKVVLAVDDTAPNVYDDGNPCTVDTCMSGTSLHQAISGSICFLASGATGSCDSQGACVECLVDDLCKSKNDQLPICKAGKCVALHCSNGKKDDKDKETSFDCGGPDCGPCPNQGTCDGDTDCQSLVCDGIFNKSCSLPSCNDTVKNGKETDVDCGAACQTKDKLCGDGKRCALPTDCVSGVCKAGICQAPNCIDGVKNGGETEIDCGGGCDPALCFKHP